MSKHNAPHKTRKLRIKATATETICSAKALASLVLQSAELRPAHKRDVLHYVIWKTTEAKHGKHRLPLRSVAAHEQIERPQRDWRGRAIRNLRHEHVYTREWLVEQLMKPGSNVSDLLDELAIACVVTKEEADLLDEKRLLIGWHRYRDAGLKLVIVAADGSVSPFDIPEPVRQLPELERQTPSPCATSSTTAASTPPQKNQ